MSRTVPVIVVFNLETVHYYLNVFFRVYNLTTNRMTRSENMMENNNQIDLKFW